MMFSALARMKRMEKESEQEFVRLQTGLPAIMVTSTGKAGSGSPDRVETQISTFDQTRLETGEPDDNHHFDSKNKKIGEGKSKKFKLKLKVEVNLILLCLDFLVFRKFF